MIIIMVIFIRITLIMIMIMVLIIIMIAITILNNFFISFFIFLEGFELIKVLDFKAKNIRIII